MALQELHPEAMLARFAFDSSDVARSVRRIKHRAFLPAWSEQKECFALSTYRAEPFTAEDLWKIARDHLEPSYGKPAKARGDLPVDEYRKCELTDDFDDEPEGHVDVVDWPPDKPNQMAIAKQLSARFMEVGTCFLPDD